MIVSNLTIVEKSVNLANYNLISMIKEIFTWWNGMTLGTRVWTRFYGIEVGRDASGNRYFRNKDDSRRWVIYCGIVDSTMVNPDWNNWLRFTSSQVPKEREKYTWQKEHISNQTGTSNAYDPEKYKVNRDSFRKNLGYKKWSQKDSET